MWVFVGYCCCEENIRVVLGWLKGIGRLDGGILTEMEGGKLWKIFDGRPENFDIINKKMLILVTKIGKYAPNLGA